MPYGTRQNMCYYYSNKSSCVHFNMYTVSPWQFQNQHSPGLIISFICFSNGYKIAFAITTWDQYTSCNARAVELVRLVRCKKHIRDDCVELLLLHG